MKSKCNVYLKSLFIMISIAAILFGAGMAGAVTVNGYHFNEGNNSSNATDIVSGPDGAI